jgi:hypothetical protein
MPPSTPRPARASDIGAALRESEIEVWVDDNGPGLPKGREKVIFQKFERGARARDTGRRSWSGHLPRHRRGARRQDSCREPRRRGARFVFSLPRGTPPTTAEGVPAEGPLKPMVEDEPIKQMTDRAAGYGIVVIEDEANIRRFIKLALESEGFQVFEADTLKRGLIEAGTRRPDLVVLDLACLTVTASISSVICAPGPISPSSCCRLGRPKPTRWALWTRVPTTT